MPGLFSPLQETKGFAMANTAQAKKRARQAEAQRKRNTSHKSALRSAVKNVKKAIAAGDKAAAQAVSAAAIGDRSHRRQEGCAQESGLAQQASTCTSH
jgi:small subunit ribosomal protein S20